VEDIMKVDGKSYVLGFISAALIFGAGFVYAATIGIILIDGSGAELGTESNPLYISSE
jgi:hypothetical protein